MHSSIYGDSAYHMLSEWAIQWYRQRRDQKSTATVLP